jgi:hypothetical protein
VNWKELCDLHAVAYTLYEQFDKLRAVVEAAQGLAFADEYGDVYPEIRTLQDAIAALKGGGDD